MKLQKEGQDGVFFLQKITSDRDKDTFVGKPILGNETAYVEHRDCCFIIAIGNPRVRERISNSMAGAERLLSKALRCPAPTSEFRLKKLNKGKSFKG